MLVIHILVQSPVVVLPCSLERGVVIGAVYWSSESFYWLVSH